jgi:hypothetical protein
MRVYSAYPPSVSQPVNCPCSHRFSRPLRQKRHVPQPGHSDPVAYGRRLHSLAQTVHPAHHLVPGHDGAAAERQFPLHGVQVGVAETAGGHFHPDLAGAGFGHRQVGRPQRGGLDRSGVGELHRAHRGASRMA